MTELVRRVPKTLERFSADVLIGLLHAAHFADPQQVANDIVGSLERGSPDALYTPGIWRNIMTAVKLVRKHL